MELKDTVNYMVSGSHRDQMRAEYYQLSIRIEDLKKYIESNPGKDTTLHQRQLNSMMLYLGDLCARLVSEGIDVHAGAPVLKQMLFD